MSRRSSISSVLMVAGLATLIISSTARLPAFADDGPFDQPGAPAGLPQPQQNQDGLEVMGRGPIHEAFAEPVVANPGPGIVIPKQPPEPVEEVPPDQAPAGTNVAWIPGYWAWDDDRNDFLWVSGFYREIPEGREWIPGYWTQSNEGEGFQWVSGYWGSLETQVAMQPDGQPDGTAPDPTEEYLPEPPQSLEAGPSTQPPEPDQVWIPGVWSWQDTRYAWRPGYWVPPQVDYMWIPAHYCWTPRGYRFVNGYWDYPVARRGLLFAPVYFTRPVYAQQGFSYSPAVSIDLSLLTDSLFVRPSYCHYYFGDYYGENYARAGVIPWFDYHSRRGGYDPIYTYYRHQHRDRGWDNQMRAQYQYRREHADSRPPRLFARGGVGGRDRNSIVKPLAFLAANNRTGLRIQRINDQQRRQLVTAARDVRRFTQQRVSLETRGRAGDRDRVPGRVVRPEDRRPGDRRPGDTRPDLPGRQPGRADPAPRLRSPIAARPAQPEPGKQPQPGTVRALPARPKEPRPDPKILPNPRRPGETPDARNPLVQPPRTGDGKLPPRTVDPPGKTPRVPTTPPVTNPPKIDPGRPGLTPTPPRTPTIPPTQPPKQTPRAGPDPIPPSAPPRTPQPPREPPTLRPPTTPPKQTPRAGPDPIPPRAPPRTPQPPREPPTVKPPATPPKLAPQPPSTPPKVNPMPTPPKLAPQPPKAPPQPPRTQPQLPRALPQPPVQPQPPKVTPPPVQPQPPKVAPQPPKSPPQPPKVAPQPPPKAPPQPPPKPPEKKDPKKKP